MASNNGHISHYTAIKETQHCHCHNSENKVVWQCLGVSFFTGQNLFTARVWSRHTTQPSRKPNIVIIQIINVPKAPRPAPLSPAPPRARPNFWSLGILWSPRFDVFINRKPGFHANAICFLYLGSWDAAHRVTPTDSHQIFPCPKGPNFN